MFVRKKRKNIKYENNIENHSCQGNSSLKDEKLNNNKPKKLTISSLESLQTSNTSTVRSNSENQLLNQCSSFNRVANEEYKELEISNIYTAKSKKDNNTELVLNETTEPEQISNKAETNETNGNEKEDIEFLNKKIPLKVIISDKSMEKETILKNNPNAASLPKLLLKEKLKRDYFGKECSLSLEQMLFIIKIEAQRRNIRPSQKEAKNNSNETNQPAINSPLKN